MRQRNGYGRYTKGGHSYEWLLEYDEVRKWIDEYTSLTTKEGYLRALEYFLKYYDTTPDRIVAIGREDMENNTKTKQKS
ncbi:MAG: hypothetical protein ACFFA5_08015 [Promethearchaeota archaeon]